MAKELNLDLLEKLLEEHEPGEIRAMYGEALENNSACASMLAAFESMDDDLHSLKEEASAPPLRPQRPDMGALVRPSFGQQPAPVAAKKRGFLQWVVPLAAALFVGFLVVLERDANQPLKEINAGELAEAAPEAETAVMETADEGVVDEDAVSLLKATFEDSVSSVEELPESVVAESEDIPVAESSEVRRTSIDTLSNFAEPYSQLPSKPKAKTRAKKVSVQPQEQTLADDPVVTRQEKNDAASPSPTRAAESYDLAGADALEEDSAKEKDGRSFLGQKLEAKRGRMDSKKKSERQVLLTRWLDKYEKRYKRQLGRDIDRSLFRLNASVRWPSEGKRVIAWPKLEFNRDLQNNIYELRWSDEDGNSGLMELRLDEEGYAIALRAF